MRVVFGTESGAEQSSLVETVGLLKQEAQLMQVVRDSGILGPNIEDTINEYAHERL